MNSNGYSMNPYNLRDGEMSSGVSIYEPILYMCVYDSHPSINLHINYFSLLI